MRRLAASTLLVLLLVRLAPAVQAAALEVVPDRRRVTVGDPVTLEVRARLTGGAVVVDRVPRPLEPLPGGLRILSAGGVERAEDGALVGRLRVAFFRPGRRQVPALALAYRAGAGGPVETLLSRPVDVEVVSVLPPAEARLRDIKAFEPLPDRLHLLLWTVLPAGGAAGYALYRLRRRAPPQSAAAPAAAGPRSAWDAALERLAQVEQAGWPARGAVDRHYELVVEVLRRCLEEAFGVRASALTTAELVRALPAALRGGGLEGACRGLLEEADLVKFAGRRPDPAAAAAFLARARQLLAHWRDASDAARAPAAAQAGRASPGRTADEASADALR